MSNPKAPNNVERTTQEVQLVKGLFTPSEANHIINVLIEQKVNFHKLQRLSLCEDNEEADVTYENNQIAKDYIAFAQKDGYNVVINSTLNISFVK